MLARTDFLSIRDYIELNRAATTEEGVAVRASLYRYIEDFSKVVATNALLSTLHDLDRLRIQDAESPQIVNIRSNALAALATIEQ